MPEYNPDDRNAFFDALDELAGSGGSHDLLPAAWYEFMVSVKEFKPDKTGALMARCEMTVCNDGDGYDGRKVWVNMSLEGTDAKGRAKCWFLAKLVKGLEAQYGRDVALQFVPFPGWQSDTKQVIVLRDRDTLEPDLTEWTEWFDRLAGYPVLAEVTHKAGRTKQADGSWKVDPSAPKEADIKGFKVAGQNA